MVNGALLTIALLSLAAFCIAWPPAVLLVLSAGSAALLRVRVLNQAAAAGGQQ